jgi:methylation protein EvaC
MLKSFSKLSKKIKRMKEIKKDKILEIGSNDGAFTINFNKKNIICVEPCGNLAKITKNMNYKTYSEYWNLKLAKKILGQNGKVDIIFSSNTISHIED